MMNNDEFSESTPLSPNTIRDIAYAFQRSRILLTAYELGLFTALGDDSKSSTEVATTLETDPRATDRLMNALCAIGLLEKKGDKFSNTPAAAHFLVQGKPEYMTGLMHTVHLWDRWSTLTSAVRQGKSVATRPVNERGEKWLTAFIAAMHDRARKQAPVVASILNLSGVSRLLDVGGGPGTYAMSFVRAKEGISATVFDLPTVVPLTRAYIEKEGLADKIQTVAGDYTVDDLGSGYDLVFLSAIIHSNAVEENRKLIRKCVQALNARGQLVVQDFIMDENRTSPATGAFFALNMLVGTECGDTYTESEVRRWMEEAGLSNITRKDTHLGTTLLIGKKSET
ncbi:MAG: acetylserotonin O-methyltransferase [candidate division KSB1 bacterium]|nr:acetylserotonin O-methyltransferase [candidate division KSB1 bacterium]